MRTHFFKLCKSNKNKHPLSEFLIYVLLLLTLNVTAEGAALNLSIKDTEGKPATAVVFQIFPGSVGVDDDVEPLQLPGRASDSSAFAGYATDAKGNLRLELEEGLYTLVGFSQKQHFVLMKKMTVPGSAVISAADALPVNISCRAADGSPIQVAEIFFRPTKRARASVGFTDNGLLKAYVSRGEYHVVLQSQTGASPHYLVLPHQTISLPEMPVNFHAAELPIGELYFDLPGAAMGISTFEVLKSEYTNEFTRSIEAEVGYDTHYTDFYSFINSTRPYMLSAEIGYEFSLSFLALFGADVIYAYEFWLTPPDPYLINPGAQRISITDDKSFTLQVSSDRGASDPVYHPGDIVTLHYEFRDDMNGLLHRILSYSEARLVFPNVTIWDADGVPIANNFGAFSFFDFSFTLPASAGLGEYRAQVTLETGIYGKLGGSFQFSVRPASDVVPPQIDSLDIPSESEAGQALTVSATVTDDVGLASNPELRLSVNAGAPWTQTMLPNADDDLYQTVVSADVLVPGELNWHISARDLAGNSVGRAGVTNILDTSPPLIIHELLAAAELGRELRIQADVRDNAEIEEVILFYAITGAGTESIMMSAIGSVYSASIRRSEVTFDGIGYYIQAIDAAGNTAFVPAGANAPQFAPVIVADTTAPIISHTAVGIGVTNIPVRVEAAITDNSGIVEATLSYKSAGDENYQSMSMNRLQDVYFAHIPAEAVVPESIQYHITARDGVDPDGNVRTSASPISGDYFIEIQSEPGGGSVSLDIFPSADQNAPLSVVAGESVRFTTTGRGSDVVWTAIGGIGHIDQDGLFIATGQIGGHGVGKITATARYTDANDAVLQATAWVHISSGTPNRIILNPGSAMMEAGDSLRFFATVTDEYSNPVQAEVNWSVEGLEQAGTINDGVFSASKTGRGNIVAEVNGVRATSEVAVVHGMLRSIVISPWPADVGEITAGETMQFTAEGHDAFGNEISIAPVWSVRGGIGMVRGDGLFRGGMAGSGQVIATVGDVSILVDVQVVPGALVSISVSPYIAYLPLSTAKHSSTQQYVADGWDIAGNPAPMDNISWSADALAGNISGSGLFTATDRGVQVGNVVTNGTIWAVARSSTGQRVDGSGLAVIQKSPASQLASVNVLVQGGSGDPGSIPIATGESVQFEAVGSDSQGQNLSVYPSWAVEGGIGDIDVYGFFTATKPGSGAIVATAGGFTGRAQIQITPGSLKSIVIRPDVLVLPPGAQRSLTAIGYDTFENMVPLENYDIRWSVAGIPIKIEVEGDSCAIVTENQGNSIVSVNVGDISGSANIFVSWASIASHEASEEDHRNYPYYLDLEPELADVAIGSQQQFTPRVVDVMGNVRESAGGLSWSVMGDIGEIDQAGLFQAGERSGYGRIIVTDGQTFGVAAVTVSESAANVEELLIIPSEVSLSSGAAQEFTVLIRTLNGELAPTLPAWRVIGSMGNIDSSGRFMATTAGEGEVEATVFGLLARCRVTVSAGRPTLMDIQPDSVSIESGEQRKFSVVSRDEAGNMVDSSPVFQTVGNLGTVNENGLFTAQQIKAGSVLAALPSSALLEEAIVEVLPGRLVEVEIVRSSNIQKEVVRSGSSIRFSAVGRDAYGNMVPVSPSWEIDGPADIGNISSNGLFMADKVGQGQIRARAGGLVDSVSVEVTPAAPAFIQVNPPLISVSSQSAGMRQFSYMFLDLRGNIAEPTGSVELSWAVTEGIGSIDPQTGLFVNEINLDEPRTGQATAILVMDRGTERERTIRGMATVVVSPTISPLASITVTPDSVQVIKGAAQKFMAAGRDSDGVEVAIYPEWRVISDDGGSEVPRAISVDGIFSATPEMQIGSSWRVLGQVTNSQGQLIQGEARLSLTTGPLQSIEIICSGDSCADPIESGKQIAVEAVGYDQFRNQVEISPEWKTAGEVGAIRSVSGARDRAVFTAGLAGSGEIIVEDEGKEGKVHVIVIPGQLADIEVSTDPAPSDESMGVSEANPLMVKSGLDVRFMASGHDSDVDAQGDAKPVNMIDISPIWSLESSDEVADIGSISSDGRFVGREIGTGRVTAEVDSVSGVFYIQVIPGDLASIRVSPSPVSVVSGAQKQFSSTGYDQNGNEISDHGPAWQVTGNIGDIDENGLLISAVLTQGSPSISGTVEASVDGIQGAASVTVVYELGELSAISVSVEPSTVQAGNKAVCILRGVDEQGNPISEFPASDEVSISVPTRLGVVAASGRPNEWEFRANRNLPSNLSERTGLLTIEVTVGGKTLSANASITLIPGQLSRIAVEPASARLSAGSTAAFAAIGYDAWENQRGLAALEWTVFGGVGDVTVDTGQPQEAVFSATIAGQGQLIASSQGYEGRADLTILPGELKTITIEPAELTITAGVSHLFSAVGSDQYGNEIADLNLDWQIRGDASRGSVSADGLFSAKKMGNVKLMAVYNGIDSNEASITIIHGGIASANIVVSKAGETLRPPFALLSGVHYELHVQGTDELGNTVSRLENSTWNLLGDKGLIEVSTENSADAVFTALFPGRDEITVTVDGIFANVDVEIVPHSQNVSSGSGATVSGPFDASIEIPPGALRNDETISVALSSSPGSAEGAQQIGYAYSFKPDGVIFDIPVKLTLSYSSSSTPEMDDEKLSLYSWDRFQEKWVRVGGEVNPNQESVTANVNYLSLFAIMQEEFSIQDEPTDDSLDILDVRLSPNTYFAPEINRLIIHYKIGGERHQTVAVTVNIYDIRGRLVRELIHESPKFPGWNTDQWDGTDEAGELVKNGRYILLITAETDDDKVNKVKHLAVFK